MAHKHPVFDMDKHFIIDPITRTITNAESKKTLLMQNDHNSEQFSFEIDRKVEGHDILKCNRVEVHYSNIDSTKRNSSLGVYTVTDMRLSDDETKVIFTWLVSEQATIHAGSLSFLILFACTEGDEVVYRWNTGINTSIAIAKGMYNGDFVVESYPDILTQWQNELSLWREEHDKELQKDKEELFAAVYGYKTLSVGPDEPTSYPYLWFDTQGSDDGGLITVKDANGNKKVLYPCTKAEFIEGLNALVDTLAKESLETLAADLYDKAESDEFSLTFLASGWAEETVDTHTVYSQTVTVEGISSGDKLLYDVELPYDPDVKDTLLDAWGNLKGFSIVDGTGLKAEFYEAPEADMTVKFIRVRNGSL